jgi:hypothetical protein
MVTHEQIDVMEAGREIDALVAELVMKIKLCKHEVNKHGKCIRCGLNKSYFDRIVPPEYYSTNIAAAWRVVEEMERKDIPTQWKFVDTLLEMAGDIVEFIFWLKPIFICRAALKVVMND